MEQHCTILIVDRSADNRQAYERHLSQSDDIDYQVLQADSSCSALKILQQTTPQAILLNSELADLIEFERYEAFLPIVVIVSSTAIAYKFLQAGAKDYILDYNLTPGVLRHTLQSAILRHQATFDNEQYLRLRQHLHYSQIALKQSEDRLRLALEAAQMGAWEWDLVTDQLSWSPNYIELVGLDSNSCPTVLQDWETMVHPSDRAAAQARLSHALQSATELQDEYRIIKPTGEIRWLSCKGQIYRNEQGEPVRMLGITQDITQVKHQELHRSQLLTLEKAARVKAETANQDKDEFLAIVTHELKTPLNAILGWAKILRTRRLDPDSIERALETIERNAEAQSQLLEDLLDMSRMVHGQLSLKLMSISLYSVISAAIEGVKLAAEAKQLHINFDAVDLDATISGDPKRLQQIVLNLLTNSIKFTPEGGTITVQLTSNQSTAQIKVIDTGIGIPSGFLPYVFDRFRQDASNAASDKGLGLGLAIVRQLVELHQGSVTVESAGEDQGTAFIVCFPLCQSIAAVK
ncbi:PAS domain-containing protein [Cyanobacteria bacterium FACHB-63]|nr:PAS domain-containing protein [Cyanobacteria bacterium FACHB-63]